MDTNMAFDGCLHKKKISQPLSLDSSLPHSLLSTFTSSSAASESDKYIHRYRLAKLKVSTRCCTLPVRFLTCDLLVP